MQCCIRQAQAAAGLGEVPVGACVVLSGEVIGLAGNASINNQDPTAHAEILALRQAAQTVGSYRLVGAWLYSTIEPCTMCAGALVHARIEKLIFGAREAKAGAVLSTASILDNPSLNHKVDWTEGVLAEEISVLMKDFFATRRGLA